MVDMKDYLNTEVAPKLTEKVNFKGLLSKVARINNGEGRELSDILGWDYLIRADNGVCYKFYAAQTPLIGMTLPKVTKCPLGIQVIDSYEIDIEKVIQILSTVSTDVFVSIELYWPLTPECKEPYWCIRTTSGSYIVIGANSGKIAPTLLAESKLSIDNNPKLNAIQNTTALKAVLEQENKSFSSVGGHTNKGSLENGLLVPGQAIIVDGKVGINGVIPGIENIWLTRETGILYDFTLHVQGACPKGKWDNCMEFTDQSPDTYTLRIFSTSSKEHTVEYHSSAGAITRITWDI
jgi:hypothetical protein